MMNKQQFITKINFIFEDKNIEKPSLEWIGGLYEKCKNISDDKFRSGIDRLISIPQDQWNKTYGFRGRPSIIDLIEILSGERPLTDAEKLEANRKHEEKLRICIATVINWIVDPNLEISFKNKYLDQENSHLVDLIDKYAKKKPRSDDDIVKLGLWLNTKYNADKIDFKAKLRVIIQEQNPLPFLIEKKVNNTNFKKNINEK